MQQLQPDNPHETAQAPTLTLLKAERTHFRWYHKLAAVMAAVFCFELGVFLLVYPWVNEWNVNAVIVPIWARAIWTSPWFRGGISGLGLLNIYISFTEVFRLRRFAG